MLLFLSLRNEQKRKRIVKERKIWMKKERNRLRKTNFSDIRLRHALLKKMGLKENLSTIKTFFYKPSDAHLNIIVDIGI